MPLDLIWLVAVVTAFVIFAGTLYWADHRTRELNKLKTCQLGKIGQREC
jgi:hypothetical protein